MTNITSFFNFTLFVSENAEGITFNDDIFEANVINLILLIVVVFFAAKSPIEDTFGNRQKLIMNSLENAEKKLTEANYRLYEIRLQCLQINTIIENLEVQAENQMSGLIESRQMENLDRLTKEYLSTVLVLKYKREQAKLTTKMFLKNLALQEINTIFTKLTVNKKFQENYINFSILALEKVIGEK